MNTYLTRDIRELIEPVHYHPAISVILPVEHKTKSQLDCAIKRAIDKVEKEMFKNYPDGTALLIVHKLKNLQKKVTVEAHQKSIALYVSPVFEKLMYLDIAVEEKIIIDESFEIRDLVYSKHQLHKYLVLQMNSKECNLYLGNTTTFVKISLQVPETVCAYINDVPEKPSVFSDIQERKEVRTDQFLHQIDKALHRILNNYQLPLFVLGHEKQLNSFKQITKHNKHIASYIYGNYAGASVMELKAVLKPYIERWQRKKQYLILTLLKDAQSQKRLAAGMQQVWKEAMNGKGQLLLVEKNYTYAAQRTSNNDVICEASEPYNTFSTIRDAVDDVIEKVLKNGGDVQFVDENELKAFCHIALIRYY